MTTFAINVSGAFLLALLLVYVLEIWPPTRYVRPFAGPAATTLGLAIGRMALARRVRLTARHGRARQYGWWVR
ncbi:hypothetical protein ACFV2U_48915 [Streptomyces sp. NPDC059697]|uniref:hypothetical protein n=1 Tax=Streptomyces sp. NPDC059697 TaxID=3346912 RepID=UPI0036A41660